MKQIGEYLVVRELGRGGMGMVYEAQERLSRRPVALKVMHANIARSQRGRELFVGEMGILARLDHPNVVRLLACFEDADQLVMVLELLRGETLRHVLKRQGRLSWTDAVVVTQQMLAGLDAAHQQQPAVVHRDLKPENVMLTADGVIKVMDFGVAKVMREATRATANVGTLQYMAPEQIDGSSVGPATDLYAVGLVLYEMLTGTTPFGTLSTSALLQAQCNTPAPPPPPEIQAAMPPGLKAVLDHLLVKDPAGRPSSAAQVQQALAAVGHTGGALSFAAQVEAPQTGAGLDSSRGSNPASQGLASAPASAPPIASAPGMSAPGDSDWAPSMAGSTFQPPGPSTPHGSFPGASQWMASSPGDLGAAPTPAPAPSAPGTGGGLSQPGYGSVPGGSEYGMPSTPTPGAAPPIGFSFGPPTPPPKKRTGLWIGLAALALVVGIGATSAVFLMSGDKASSSSSSASASASSSDPKPQSPTTPETPTTPPSIITPTPTPAADEPTPGEYPADFAEAANAACKAGPAFVDGLPEVPQAIVAVADFDGDGTEDAVVDYLRPGDPVTSSLLALSGETMKPLWKSAPQEFNALRRYLVHEGVLLEGAGRDLAAIELSTGNVRWKRRASDDLAWFVVEDEFIHLTTTDGKAASLDFDTGKPSPTRAEDFPKTILPPREDAFPQIEGLRFEAVVARTDCIRSFGAANMCPHDLPFARYKKSPGTPIPHIVGYREKTVFRERTLTWDRELPDFRDLTDTIVTVADDDRIVVLGYGDGEVGLTLLSARDGSPKWSHTWKAPHSARALAKGDDRMYLVAGCLLAVDIDEGKLLQHRR